MAVVTLTTDFGLRDYYVGALKGEIISENPGIQLVDISHLITPFDIVEAAYTLRNIISAYPRGSFHVVYVKNHMPEQTFLFFEYQYQYYILPNNGIHSLIFGDLEAEIRTIPPREDRTPFQSIARLIRDIRLGADVRELYPVAEGVVSKIPLQPIVHRDQIRAAIIHIDRYGNAVINLQRSLFERVRKNRPFKIFFKNTNPITRIAKSYADGNIGEPIALFNMQGYLVIATIMGNAAEELDLKKDESIQIVFG